MLKTLGLTNAPLRPYDLTLNSMDGKRLHADKVIDLPIWLGTIELEQPLVVVDRLHVDDALKAFRAVVDLDTNTVTLKGTGDIGAHRVEEMYTTRISLTVRVIPGGSIATARPLPDALMDLPDQVASLERQLWAAQTEATAAVRSVAHAITARENAESFLKAANAEVDSLRMGIKLFRDSNAKNDLMISSVQSSMEQHTEELKRLHCEVHARDAFIATLN
ncbi:hypothetical protein PInf_018361 [Phytophthora infestans]|nr:hypothetical protein PInf_018361 [Phytophthora infestans]